MYLQRWHGWCRIKLLPSQRILCTLYNHAPCHFMQSHICKGHACLAVTCDRHFWQNDQDILCAAAVTWGWNGYRNKNQHRKLTQEKKILPPLLPGLKPTTFQSWVQHSSHCAIPTPHPVCSLSSMLYPVREEERLKLTVYLCVASALCVVPKEKKKRLGTCLPVCCLSLLCWGLAAYPSGVEKQLDRWQLLGELLCLQVHM